MANRINTKVYNLENKIFGKTFTTDYQHTDNHYHYEIFVRVPDGHNQPNATYETIENNRTMKIASKGLFPDSGRAFEAMMQRIEELLAKVSR